jgi:Fungal protein kinase
VVYEVLGHRPQGTSLQILYLIEQSVEGSEADRKLDIFLTPAADAALPDGEHDWSYVLVIGEYKRNLNEDRSIATLMELAGYAREVFGSQPDRRFML